LIGCWHGEAEKAELRDGASSGFHAIRSWLADGSWLDREQDFDSLSYKLDLADSKLALVAEDGLATQPPGPSTAKWVRNMFTSVPISVVVRSRCLG
jgi:hypothetical protein